MIPAERVERAQNTIDGLTALANNTTGAGDANITDAVSTLIDGYNKGGGGGLKKVLDVTVVLPADKYELLCDLPYTIDTMGVVEEWMSHSIYALIMDDGTTPFSSTTSYATQYVYGSVPKELFSWSPFVNGYIVPIQKATFQKSDGSPMTWSDSQSYASAISVYARTSSESFYATSAYGSFRFYRNVVAGELRGLKFGWTRGNANYQFKAGTPYRVMLWVGDD